MYIGGNIECPAFDESVIEYIFSPEFTATQAASKSVYETIGPIFLGDVSQPDQWDFINAYAIYDYLNYMYEHNTTFNSMLSDSKNIDPSTNISYLDTLRWYADQQQYSQLGNLNAKNNITSDPFPGEVSGSISTISGNLLAAKMVAQLQANIDWQGEYYKLSVMFGDYQPFMSFFALADLPSLNSNFYGLPDFGSVAVFELFSHADSSDGTQYPSEEDLYVRFYFRNGTDSDQLYQSYSLFNNGPDTPDMKWVDFVQQMNQIMIGDVGVWCQQCGAYLQPTDRIFCSYWNATESISADTLKTGSHGPVSPVVGGVIGALIALVVAGLLFGAIMLIGGVRFHRVKSRKSEMGGFKGGQKMASDKDLTLPKGGAIVGASVETPGSPVPGGHERVGSWELKQHDMPNIAATHPARRPSFEEDDDIGDIGAAPFRKPTEPNERV